MAIRMYREYLLRFYLNAQHFGVVNGRRKEVHSHTWEFALTIRVGRDGAASSEVFEDSIHVCLAPYQDRLLNETDTFRSLMPTLENMTDYFSEEFFRRIAKAGGTLMKVAVSETPAKTYIVNLEERTGASASESQMLDQLVDSVLEDILH